MRDASRPILVVDDDHTFRELIATLLGNAGFRVCEVATGEEAVAVAKIELPALAIVDVCLPGLSGYEVHRELRDEFGEEVPVIFVSGIRVEAFDRIGGLLLGADDYVVKPFSSGELMARIRRLLDRASANSTRGNGRLASLTPRERQVIDLLAAGRDQHEIASELVISPKTVATHIQRALTKLNARSRAQAVAIVLRGEHDRGGAA